jgi:hypothetical protein
MEQSSSRTSHTCNPLGAAERRQLANIYAFVLKAGEAKRTAAETERSHGDERGNEDASAKRHSTG